MLLWQFKQQTFFFYPQTIRLTQVVCSDTNQGASKGPDAALVPVPSFDVLCNTTLNLTLKRFINCTRVQKQFFTKPKLNIYF